MIKQLDETFIDDIVKMRYEMQKEEKDVDINALEENESIIKKNSKEYIEEHLNKDLYVFGYIINDKLVSMASLLIHKYYPGFDNIKGIKGRVSAVYTDKDYRHKGYQTQVLKFLITKAFEMELPSIKVNSNNPVAVKLYEKVGFKKANNCYKITP